VKNLFVPSYCEFIGKTTVGHNVIQRTALVMSDIQISLLWRFHFEPPLYLFYYPTV